MAFKTWNIYFAGPLFTTAERDFNAVVVALLRGMGHKVFLPQESEQKDGSAHTIFMSDLEGVQWANIVVANMDGSDPDSGTCWECGYAAGNNMPVVLYRTDIREERQPFGPYNLMLHQSAQAVLDCKWQSPAVIAQRIDSALQAL